jgi:glycosyltransferase involved in cell wall biosynthesis
MKEMLEAIGVPQSHIVVVPNAIDPEEFHPEVPSDEIRRLWDMEGKTILGFVGWFKKWHGLESVIELYAENGWKSENLQLFFVGDGPARSDLEEIARKYGVSSSVTITGSVPRDKIPAYISAMDIALQPSAPEYASPIKIFEYMGMGKCIVAPDQPNIRELIEDGRTGLLFKPGNKSSMGEVLRKALDTLDLRSQLGSNARQEIFDKGYLWQKNAERAIELVFPGHSSVAQSERR